MEGKEQKYKKGENEEKKKKNRKRKEIRCVVSNQWNQGV